MLTATSKTKNHKQVILPIITSPNYEGVYKPQFFYIYICCFITIEVGNLCNFVIRCRSYS